MAVENMLVARNVRRFRQERQLSLGDLAKRSGLAKQTLSKIEQGTGNPTVETLVSLSTALDVSTRRLLTEWGTPVYVLRSEQGSWESRHGHSERVLDEVYGSGHVRTTVLRLSKSTAAEHRAEPQPPGTLHHLYVIAGRVSVGPTGEQVSMAPGDFVRFPGDVAHSYTCLSDTAVLHVVITVPQLQQFGPSVAH